MKTDYLELMRQHPENFPETSGDTPLRILTDAENIRRVEQQVGRECGILFQDDFVLLLRDAVIFPNGAKGTYVRIVPRASDSAVVILPIRGDRILLLSHYRHSLCKYLWELPRGFGELGLSAEQNAVKELREEISVVPLDLEHLGQIHPDSGLQSTQVTAYMARLPEHGELQNADLREIIKEYRFVTSSMLKEMIQTDQITDAFTLSTITLAITKGKLAF